MGVRFTRIKAGYYPFPVWEFNLPAGHTCPFALACLTKADRETGVQFSGKHQEYRCYAAVVERYPAVRGVRWSNFDSLRGKSRDEMADMIKESLPRRATHVRIHGGGDFFNQDYFDAWLLVCASFPAVKFWAFTKSVGYWVSRISSIPENLTMQASYGGREDHLISTNGLKFAKVFNTMVEVADSGLPLDTDDTLAMSGSVSFALLENYSADAKSLRRAAKSCS